jgi:hypothetical protein
MGNIHCPTWDNGLRVSNHKMRNSRAYGTASKGTQTSYRHLQLQTQLLRHPLSQSCNADSLLCSLLKILLGLVKLFL